MTDGTELRGASDYPRGNPENPVSTRDLEAKFLGLVGRRFGGDVAKRALAAVQSIETSTDMHGVFADLLTE
jgi:2-methylcitrate dehydratase PrpD